MNSKKGQRKFKHNYMKRILPTLMLTLFIPGIASAQEALNVKSVKAVIKGTSSLHDWESNITQIDFRGMIVMDNGVPKEIQDVKVSIPVKTIKSSEGRIMDNKTYEAFHSDLHPFITFIFSRSQVTVDQSNIIIKAPGQLTMAGTTKSTVVEARGRILANGDLQLAVSQKINMTDFNMEPPTVVLGTIKVGEWVTVVADLVLHNTTQATGLTTLKF